MTHEIHKMIQEQMSLIKKIHKGRSGCPNNGGITQDKVNVEKLTRIVLRIQFKVTTKVEGKDDY
jgi:hypothetical protein